MAAQKKPFYEAPKVSKLDESGTAFGSIIPEGKCDPLGSSADTGCADGTGVGEHPIGGFTYCNVGTSGERFYIDQHNSN